MNDPSYLASQVWCNWYGCEWTQRVTTVDEAVKAMRKHVKEAHSERA